MNLWKQYCQPTMKAQIQVGHATFIKKCTYAYSIYAHMYFDFLLWIYSRWMVVLCFIGNVGVLVLKKYSIIKKTMVREL